MLGLIVSLLFLSPILDGFQALDGSGRPLPHAVLTFLRSGTTIPKAVYADQDLEVELSDAAGRVTADAQGRFPLIYLAADPTPRYRVMLHTAQGVLRWDIDPYVCDCTEPPYLFRSPKHQALDEDGNTLPGARLTFTLTETETPANVYADAARRVPLPNPLKADAGGFFPPVYLDDETEYRVRLADRSGNELLDVDPYICECGFLLLTSQPYPYEFSDKLEVSVDWRKGIYWPSISDELAIGVAFVSATLETPLQTYEIPADELEVGIGFVGGSLETPLRAYEIPADEFEVGIGFVGGSLEDQLVRYEQWPTEELDIGIAFVSGTLE